VRGHPSHSISFVAFGVSRGGPVSLGAQGPKGVKTALRSVTGEWAVAAPEKFHCRGTSGAQDFTAGARAPAALPLLGTASGSG